MGFGNRFTDSFDSIDKRSVSSWNDPGFDVVGGSYTLQSPLDIGKSGTGKLETFKHLSTWRLVSRIYFLLPDLNYNQVQPGLFTTEYFQVVRLRIQIILTFELFVTDSTVPQTDNGAQSNSHTREACDGTNSSILISIPMPLDMHPERIFNFSNLFFKATTLSSQNVKLAIREVLQLGTSMLTT